MLGLPEGLFFKIFLFLTLRSRSELCGFNEMVLL